MPNSLLTFLRKPLSSNKRLIGLVTIAILFIAALGASYYYHIENNKQNFREYKLQTLDSYYDIISRRLANDFLTFYARPLTDSIQKENSLAINDLPELKVNLGNTSKTAHDSILSKQIAEKNLWKKNKIAEKDLWNILASIKKPLNIEQEFDEYIIVFKDETKSDSKLVKQTSLKGLVNFDLDSLLVANPFNIGLSKPIPLDDPKYQLFARNYSFNTDLNKNISLQITIIGLVKAERYNEYTRKLDPWIIALLTTFLLLCLFGLPYFKMIFIAEDERLSTRDVIMSGIAVVIGTPVIFAIFMSLMNYYDDYYNVVPHRLEKLGEKIRYRFERENDSLVSRLDRLDLTKYDFESTTYGDDIRFFQASESDSTQSESFKFITKVDAKGDVFYHINVIKSPPKEKAPTSLKNRIYFKDYKASENVWKSSKGISYVMRPVVSIEDQTEEAVYILADNINRSCMKIASAQLKSIHDPILPFGYKFAVIDERGEVWFHSEDGRSTLENFYSVSRQHNDLKGAITGRVNARGLLKYRDENKLFNVTPIKGTNLSVISMYDLGLLRVRISETLSLSGISIFLAFILLALVTSGSLLIRNPQLGLYKYRAFLFEFLTPKKSRRDTYILLSALFLALLFGAVLLCATISFVPSSAFILSFLCITWTYLIVYYSLHPNRNKRAFKFRVRDVLLLFLVIILNKLLFEQGSENTGFLSAVVIVQILLLVFLIGGQLVAIPEGIKRICRFNAFRIRIAYRYWYAIFLFSWLLLSTVFPTYVFFEKAKAINEVIWIKADQIQSVMAYVEKEEKLRNKLKAIKGKESEFLERYAEHLEKGQYLDAAYSLDKYDLKTEPLSQRTVGKKNIFRELLWASRPIYDEKVRRFQGMVYQSSWDNTWKSTEQADSLKFRLRYSKENDMGVLATYATKKNNGHAHFLNVRGLKWIGFTAILAMLFSLILFFVDRFFAFRFRHLKANDFDTNNDQDYVGKFAKILRSEDSNSGLLLIGLPFSGKGNFGKDIIAEAGYKHPTRLSFLKLDNLKKDADIPEILDTLGVDSLNSGKSHLNWKNKDAFLIENMEHNLKSFDANRIKLRLISFLISEKKRVVLTSEVYPSQILALYETLGKKSESMDVGLERDFNSWRNILSAFPQVLIGITDGAERVKAEFKKEPKEGASVYDVDTGNLGILSKELGYSKFLPVLAPVIHSKNIYFEEDRPNQAQLDEQRMVMHTQNLGHGYYTDIWNSLPTRERYMLYDLAKDGFLNIKNGNSLFSLMKKGLVVWRDRPVIFNYSFKNFIISSVSMNEALRLEYKNRGEGSWGTVRIIFYLVILTIIIFILLGEPGILKDFETLIGAIGGLGVIIPVISSLLARGGQKQ